MYDKNDVTATIKTFMRPDKFEKCLQCAIDAGLVHILVGYDGPEGELLKQHKEICEHYSNIANIQLQFIKYPFNLGLSGTRNAFINECKTPFFLQLDDDNYVPSNILDALPFIKNHNKIGMVGFGWVNNNSSAKLTLDAADFELIDGYLLKKVNIPKKIECDGGLVFLYPFDYVPNIAIFDKRVFDDVRWDDTYIIGGEHLDFYLSLYKNTDWKAAISTSIFVAHSPDSNGDNEFTRFRFGSERVKSERYFLKKWNLKGVVGWRQMYLDAGVYVQSYDTAMKSDEARIRRDIKKKSIKIKDLHYSYLYNEKGRLK